MNGVRMAGLVLIVAGALALAYGGFSYTRETQQASIGPLHLSALAVGEWLILADGTSTSGRLIVQASRALSDSAQTGGYGLPSMAFDNQKDPP